jgi:hypothetical protein
LLLRVERFGEQTVHFGAEKDSLVREVSRSLRGSTRIVTWIEKMGCGGDRKGGPKECRGPRVGLYFVPSAQPR